MAFVDPNAANGVISLDSWCDNFIKTYAKVIADKKERGVMNVNEKRYV